MFVGKNKTLKKRDLFRKSFNKKTHRNVISLHSSLKKHMNKEFFMKLEYPYYKNETTFKQILNDFTKLKNYHTKFIRYNPIKRRINTFQNRLVIIKVNYEEVKDLIKITDYFSESCRVKCLNNLKETLTPFEYFNKNKEIIYNKLSNNDQQKKLSYNDISEYLFKNIDQCTRFNATVMISILKLLKPKKILDPSSGWGDRLISSIAYGCSYTGVDPSNCMNPIYHEIIDKLASKDRNKDYKIIHNGFENVDIEENSYDLVFTSPPFFDFELYENDESQSISKFNTLEKWLNGFMFPLIDKSNKALVTKGYLGLYISDYTGVSFINQIFKYIKNNIKTLNYQGDIHFWNETNPKVIRTVFFWRKI
jgi:hypothetical protein